MSINVNTAWDSILSSEILVLLLMLFICPLMKSMIYLQNIWTMKYNVQHTYIYWNTTLNSPRQISRYTRLFISKPGTKIQSVTQTPKLFGKMEVFKRHASVKTAKLVVFNLPPKMPKYKNTQPFFFLVFFSPMLFFFSVSMPIFIINLSQSSFKNMHFRRI